MGADSTPAVSPSLWRIWAEEPEQVRLLHCPTHTQTASNQDAHRKDKEMTIKYVVTHPVPKWYRYRRLCGINTTRGVSEFNGMTTKERVFDTLESAQAYIAEQTDPDNCYHTAIPTNPSYGVESTDMRYRTLRRDECVVTLEGV